VVSNRGAFGALLWKDFRREWRSKETVQAGLVMVGLFFFLFLYTGAELGPTMATVAIWSPILYATAAMSGRALANENDRGTLEWILSLPVGRGLHGWSRGLVELGVLSLIAAATLAIAHWAFAVVVNPVLLATIALATIGLGLVGAMAGGLAAQARAREILLPLLLIPVAAPLLQAGVQATNAALRGSTDRLALLVMAGYDIIALGVAMVLWPLILEAD
jgi:ABC-type transport system involved in cytochrome c biogenesis permease component